MTHIATRWLENQPSQDALPPASAISNQLIQNMIGNVPRPQMAGTIGNNKQLKGLLGDNKQLKGLLSEATAC